MIIRYLEPNEHAKCALLMGTAFKYSVDTENIGELKENLIGAFCDDNETLMAQISVKDYKVYVCGKETGCLGIAGVSTYPEYRRNGCIRALFTEIFKEIKEKGWVISLLYPFSYNYYRQFGYEVFMQRKTLSVPFSELKKFDRNNSVKLYNGEKDVLDGLLKVYAEFASKRNCCMIRNDGERFSDQPAKSLKYTYLWYNGNNPEAYVTVSPGQDGKLEVVELVYTSPESLKGVLGFLRLYEGQYKGGVYFGLLENDSPVFYLLGVDHDVTVGGYYGFEGRVVDIEKFLEINEYPESKGEITIKIYGDVISENNGIYHVDYENKKGVVTKISDESGYDISLPIHSFSRLAIGDVTKESIPYLDGAQMNCDIEKVSRCFPHRTVQLFERF